jgi:hypothetical protein
MNGTQQTVKINWTAAWAQLAIAVRKQARKNPERAGRLMSQEFYAHCRAARATKRRHAEWVAAGSRPARLGRFVLTVREVA